MSFLTEYFDEFRQYPIRKVNTCLPEERYAKLPGMWLDPKKDKKQLEWSEEDRQEFIRKTTKAMRTQSTYYNTYCAHLDPAFKTSEFVPRPKVNRLCKLKSGAAKAAEEESIGETLALKDTEIMKKAKEIYERDLDAPTLKPLETQQRILGYVRPRLYHTGISDYQDYIAKLAYVLVRDDRIPKYVASNGGRPRWGYPPEGIRQPEVDGIPLDGERLY